MSAVGGISGGVSDDDSFEKHSARGASFSVLLIDPGHDASFVEDMFTGASCESLGGFERFYADGADVVFCEVFN